jgi:hypothetical protein
MQIADCGLIDGLRIVDFGGLWILRSPQSAIRTPQLIRIPQSEIRNTVA